MILKVRLNLVSESMILRKIEIIRTGRGTFLHVNFLLGAFSDFPQEQ